MIINYYDHFKDFNCKQMGSIQNIKYIKNIRK